jgi:WD repeat-containing protein 70
VSSLTYSYDGSKLSSRSMDDTMVKVWNAPKLSRTAVPHVVCTGAETIHEKSNSAFSPNGAILVAGVSTSASNGESQSETGRLNFYDVSKGFASASPLLSLELDVGISPIIVNWHPKINQLFVCCSNGQTIVFFDPSMSKKGAIVSTAKAGKRVDDLTQLLQSRVPTGSAAYAGEIITPLYKDVGVKRKRDEKSEVVTRAPERPATGKHKTGGQSAGGAINLQQFVASKSLGSQGIAGKDPREALFKYTEGKSFVDRAYHGNTSKLADKTAEQEEEESKQS